VTDAGATAAPRTEYTMMQALDATRRSAATTPMIDMIASTRRCDLARSLGLGRHCESEGPYIAKQIFFLLPSKQQ
jgi:hypothetical protein